MTPEATLGIHMICLDFAIILVWLIGLIFLIHCFRQRKNKIIISKIVKIASILFFISNAAAFCNHAFNDISYYAYNNTSNPDPAIYKFYCHSLMSFYFIYFSFPCITFYMFILCKLRTTFYGTMYAVSTKYFIFIGFIGVISVSLYTWWAVFVVYIANNYPDYSMNQNINRFGQFCEYQFYVIDALIRISVIYLFNRRLLRLSVLQREDISSYGESNARKESLLSELNDRQEKLIRTATKQTLLICTVIITNLVWIIWGETNSSDSFGDVTVIAIISSYAFFALSILQILCVYLGFDFAEKWYQRCCNDKHLLFEDCCKQIAIRKMSSVIVTYEYTMLKEANEEPSL